MVKVSVDPKLMGDSKCNTACNHLKRLMPFSFKGDKGRKKTVKKLEHFVSLSQVEQDECLRLFIIKLNTEQRGRYNKTLQGYVQGYASSN